MTTTPTGVLLGRGGMRRVPTDDATAAPALAAALTATPPAEVTKYNGALDPAGAEELGRRLAHELRPLTVDAVLVWEDVEDVVLAHVVARELGVAVVRAFDADGLVRSVGRIASGSNVVLLSDMFRDHTALSALRSLVDLCRGTVAAVATLVDGPAVAGGVRTVSLGPGTDVPTLGEA